MDETISNYLLEGYQAGMRYMLNQPPNSPTGRMGNELSRGIGSSMEFMDHREYMPGDDLRRIDWSAYARSDRLTVKLYRQEVCPHVDILMDSSASMAIGESRKLRVAAGMAAFFTAAAENAGYSHAAWLAADGCTLVPNSTLTPLEWQDVSYSSQSYLSDALEVLPPVWQSRGVRILISDLIFPCDPLRVMSTIAAGSAVTLVVQVLAADDVEPSWRGNVRLVDSETGIARDVFMDMPAINRYKDSFSRNQDAWSSACRQVGAIMTTVVADHMDDDWSVPDLISSEIIKVA